MVQPILLGLLQFHFPDAIEIVDIYHLNSREHWWDLGRHLVTLDCQQCRR